MIEQFKQAMQTAGVNPPSNIIGDGQLHRFHIGGDKSGTLNGAYFLHLDSTPAGWFSDWRGTTGKWSADGKSQPFTKEMRQQFEHERKQRELEKQLLHEQAAKTAAYIWGKALPAPAEHPYLTRKKIKPHHARIHHGDLLIPIYNENRELVNLQFIKPDGTKRLSPNAKIKGCFSAIRRDSNTDVILLCEGFSTAASLHEETGHYVGITFGKSHLSTVAQIVRRLYPKAAIIVCGDNDLDGGGQKAARDAAISCGGTYKIPATVGTDWNDVLNGVTANG